MKFMKAIIVKYRLLINNIISYLCDGVTSSNRLKSRKIIQKGMFNLFTMF